MFRVKYNIPQFGISQVHFDSEHDAWVYAQFIRETYPLYWSVAVMRVTDEMDEDK